MTREKDGSAELDRLLDALCEEELSEPQRQRLNELLRTGEEARWRYLTEVHMHAALVHLAGLPKVRVVPEKKQLVWPSVVLGVLGDAFQAGAGFLSRSFVLTLLLAIGLPLIILTILIVDVAQQPVAKAPAPVAVAEVTDSLGCVLAEGGGDLPAGTKLFPRQQLQLRGGLAEITFSDGVRAVLEAPLILEIRDRGAGFLQRGRLAATVPPGARGFTIETPMATIVDVGTEFGVNVGNDGATEAHVFGGRIRVGERDAQQEATQSYQEFRVGQAARVRQVGAKRNVQIETIAAVPRQFIRRIPPENNSGLPEPKVLFAHRGDRDPASEGWMMKTSPGATKDDYTMAPVKDQGVAAWSIQDRSMAKDMSLFRYYIMSDKLPPEIVEKGKAQGWVMRARINLVYQKPLGRTFADHFAYCDGSRIWRIRLSLNRDGTQCFIVVDNSSLGKHARIAIPNSRGRYVDYELRYQPATDDVDVYVNGRLAATAWYGNSDEITSQEGTKERSLLRFGTGATPRHQSEMRVALVEWGLLGEASEPPSRPSAGKE